MNADTGEVMSTGTVVMVAYDYKSLKPIPVPDDWKKKISEFEGLQV
jgi:acyl-CoA thioesterase FadM